MVKKRSVNPMTPRTGARDEASIDRTRAGLDKVPNRRPATYEEFENLTNEFNAHKNDKTNPHEVTLSQLGFLNNGKVIHGYNGGGTGEYQGTGNVSDRLDLDDSLMIASSKAIKLLNDKVNTDIENLRKHMSTAAEDHPDDPSPTNPHRTTKTDVGLSRIPNNISSNNQYNITDESYSNKDYDKSDILASTKMVYQLYLYANKEIEGIKKTIEDSNKELDEHLKDYNNPHKVSKSQVGLSNIPNATSAHLPSNYGQEFIDNPELNDQEVLATTKLTNKLYLLVNENKQNLNSHISDKNNPHNVTIKQLGFKSLNASDGNGALVPTGDITDNYEGSLGDKNPSQVLVSRKCIDNLYNRILELSKTNVIDRLPVGTILLWASNTLPSDKWHWCNGEDGTIDLVCRVPVGLNNVSWTSNGKASAYVDSFVNTCKSIKTGSMGHDNNSLLPSSEDSVNPDTVDGNRLYRPSSCGYGSVLPYLRLTIENIPAHSHSYTAPKVGWSDNANDRRVQEFTESATTGLAGSGNALINNTVQPFNVVGFIQKMS